MVVKTLCIECRKSCKHSLPRINLCLSEAETRRKVVNHVSPSHAVSCWHNLSSSFPNHVPIPPQSHLVRPPNSQSNLNSDPCSAVPISQERREHAKQKTQRTHPYTLNGGPASPGGKRLQRLRDLHELAPPSLFSAVGESSKSPLIERFARHPSELLHCLYRTPGP